MWGEPRFVSLGSGCFEKVLTKAPITDYGAARKEDETKRLKNRLTQRLRSLVGQGASVGIH